MKKFLILFAFSGFIGTISAQTGAISLTTADVMKEHACSATCTTDAHAYLHGEKGHTCTEACKSVATTEKKAAGCCAGKKATASCAKDGAKAEAHASAGKDHACTEACKDGSHALACGEKGHACDATCMHTR